MLTYLMRHTHILPSANNVLRVEKIPCAERASYRIKSVTLRSPVFNQTLGPTTTLHASAVDLFWMAQAHSSHPASCGLLDLPILECPIVYVVCMACTELSLAKAMCPAASKFFGSRTREPPVLTVVQRARLQLRTNSLYGRATKLVVR